MILKSLKSLLTNGKLHTVLRVASYINNLSYFFAQQEKERNGK